MPGRFAGLILVAALLCAASTSRAWTSGEVPTPLFDSDDMLHVRIEAPFDVIKRERSVDEEEPGKFFYRDASGANVELDVGIRARGHFRRQPEVCSFPPLRLNFKKSQVEGTLFEGQNKLKLATNCNMNKFRYEQAILAEYAAYRILNILTDISFRVRLLRIRFADPGGEELFNGYGMLIEHKNSVGLRIGAPPMTVESTPLSSLDLDHLNLVTVFQYLVGNTDFAATSGAAGQPCCHNHELFGAEGEMRYSVPYDFDMAGLVNAPYAIPNPQLRLKSVEQRYYRGFCANNERLPATLEFIESKREDIETLIRELPAIGDSKRSDMLKYIDGYYRSVSNDRGVKNNLVKRCR